MSQVELAADIGNFLTLAHPFWVSSAHYSHKDSAIRAWKEIEPAAITLKTSHRRIEEEKKDLVREPTDPVIPRFGRSFYCDGPKQDELLSYEQTASLLKVAEKELPSTILGVSVLADKDEDYDQLFQLCSTARFCELNLKYGFRLGKDDRTDYFTLAKERFEKLIIEVSRFCKAFSRIPILLKIPRELSWLPKTKEASELFSILREHGKAAILIANSLKMDIPPFIGRGKEQLWNGGVICGDRLFDETIALIEAFADDCRKFNLPIVATGGMVSAEQALMALRAGASAVQLCTAFVYNGLNFYQTLCWNLQNRIESRGLRSFKEYLGKLRDEGVASVYSTPFMYFNSFWEDELQKRIKADVRRSEKFDLFLMSGKSISEKWSDVLRSRFEQNRGMRLLVPRTDAAVYIAIQKSWGLTELEIAARLERVAAAKAEFESIWKASAAAREKAAEKPEFKIVDTEKCPFYSFYLFDDKVYVALYPFVRPGELGSPVYMFSAGSIEYERIKKEANQLISFAKQSGA